MKKHHVDILISEADVRSRITELGAEITHFYQQQAIDKLIVVGLLRGSFMFMADLVRELKLPVEVEFMTTSSYGAGMTSNHDVKISKDLEGDIRNEHVLIVEDIIDTGYTLEKVRGILNLRDPVSLAICTLLDKPSRREVEVPVEWIGFSIPDEFVVGYGIDYAQRYRNLGYIGKVVIDE
ncbi:MAG: hypoxanthine phosphoribosyltransferase [Haemophilus parainfluenzae]|jgi:hypoxanthine phosphoribosyltransferase|uniref:hypoxanthine phosphoribosyltransferase n=1 Tax=uncultured Haemophilus sp. TaxID=237779 RepID=UPI002803D787|nr:hypoxanthine phosphoribosyltransferase [uncultured Haemophilus sp.]MDU4564974.1 hypoxanthine phosphoribosyltransferase [Haemophilus parainfluenzae]MDU4636958.1 hypoxanthine phosphoribosyltransferase [Haemophilus parainfluenzae]MDU5008606.1 hypoxanthine phosphoribosyltransferase [Haemophilus parainfluenzae]MDU5989657.1 hypoxanthine phosphoribosyltransferase [Haemophilus parainfluenzae]MDU7946470.1 hypoxanthine phosphoribosyltransferase [Haemophilus parainfluenzae]